MAVAHRRQTSQLSPPDEDQSAMGRRASGEQAAAYIRRLIFDGELTAGTRLPQEDIAKTLGVSRIPIREAIVALERDGWVTTQLHRGAFVNEFDEHVILDHYELFGLVYGLAVRRAVSRQAPELVERLQELARDAAGTQEPAAIERLAIEFHSTVVEAAQSPRIPVVLRAMSGLVPGPFFQVVPEAIGWEQKGLAAIARAVKRSDGERAAAEYNRMLSEQAKLVVEVFRRRGGIARSA